MKNKILIFVIGVLIGAIITTVGFLIYEKVKGDNQVADQSNIPQMMRDGNGQMTPPQMSGGEMSNNQGTPPEKPSGEIGNNQGTPPLIPSNNNT